ncbi:MAG: NYN domain-containing protein [archaeon]
MEETLVFIDEGFLSKLSKYFGGGRYIKFDKFKFAKELCNKQRLTCKQVFYYTAPPFQSDPPTEEEESLKEGYDKFVRKLRELEIIVREGRCQRLKIDGNFEYRQKAVDVLLTMDVTSIPLKYPSVKKIILIATDSDFVPVIKNLEEHGIKTILYTYYEKRRDTNFSRSNELIKSVYKYVLLKKEDFEEAKLKNKK